ncbi:MAG: (2Fe-2S)-binding protein [Afipia sp.]|jgi:bacterioferritin-associated ferredoxin|nr:(2Fe-2S)-binding protein [Afipia sp.]
MIVCSCNVLTDHDVRDVVTKSGSFPRSAAQVYGCLGCSVECGRCARTIKKIMDEALGACAQACCSGCPHSDEPDAGVELIEETVEIEQTVVLLAQAAC